MEIILTGQGSTISCDFHEPILIDTHNYDAMIGVKNFSTYNNIPNVEAGRNNKLLIR